jgi:hypothetical protein
MIFIEAHSSINLTKGSVFQQATDPSTARESQLGRGPDDSSSPDPDDAINTTPKEKAKSEAKGLKKPDHPPPRWQQPRHWQFHHHRSIPHQAVRN